VVNLADFIESLLHLGVSRHTLAGLVDLGRRLEQERLHLAFGEAAIEIIEGAVFGVWVSVAVTVGLATLHETLDQGRVEDLRRELEGTQEMNLAVAQSECGGAFEWLYPTHIYRQDSPSTQPSKQKGKCA
jgi:hypothetical protein